MIVILDRRSSSPIREMSCDGSIPIFTTWYITHLAVNDDAAARCLDHAEQRQGQAGLAGPSATHDPNLLMSACVYTVT